MSVLGYIISRRDDWLFLCQYILAGIWKSVDDWSQKGTCLSQGIRPFLATDPMNSHALILGITQGVEQTDLCQVAKPSWLLLLKDIKLGLNLPPARTVIDVEPDCSLLLLTKTRNGLHLYPLLLSSLRIGLSWSLKCPTLDHLRPAWIYKDLSVKILYSPHFKITFF